MPPLQPQIEAWTDNSHLIAPDLGAVPTSDWLPLTREAAVLVPAVARGRHLTCSAIAGCPLEAYRGPDLVTPQPTWAYSTDGQTGDLDRSDATRWQLTAQAPWYRMLWTVDDLLFYGESLWYSTALDVDGRPTRMVRFPYGAWTVDAAGVITDQDSHPLDPSRLVYFPGPHEGILRFGARTIRQASSLEQTSADVAAHPFRLELHQTTDATLTPEERRDVVNEVRAALAASDGVLFTNSALTTVEHRMDSDALLIGGRNAAALDVARHISMPGAMLDATTEGASLEYQTATARNQQWIDYGLSLYMDSIESRLGMDDVVPQGQRVAFDTADLTTPTAGPSGPPTVD
jgi:hypothetical protein